MIEPIQSNDSTNRKAEYGQVYLCLHGHFYQPPRENPFTGQIALESGASPYANFNEKITTECYAPNADAGNFDALNFDLGPTLAHWLDQTHPEILQRIIEADRKHVARYGVGNAMAQGYNHTILPLATTRDKYTQVSWGLSDFRYRYGREATGMWLAETAVDLESLDILAQHGVLYTVLAPWQAATEIDPSEPYRVRLFNGRSITVFFYNAPLSGGVSFDWNTTSNADHFVSHYLQDQLVPSKREAGQPQLVTIATDGELYGHHRPWSDMFLSRLINVGAPVSGVEICTLERYMHLYPPVKEVELRVPSSWSCSHGIARWKEGCECTEGDSSWKGTLRLALNNLAARSDQLFEQYASEALLNPWAARDAYLPLHNGWESEEVFWTRFGHEHRPPTSSRLAQRTLQLLEAQYYQQYSFTSCGFFFDNLDRIEPRNDIGFARRSISLLWQALAIDLQMDFLQDLRNVTSWSTPLTGADIYQRLPAVEAGLLPALN